MLKKSAGTSCRLVVQQRRSVLIILMRMSRVIVPDKRNPSQPRSLSTAFPHHDNLLSVWFASKLITFEVSTIVLWDTGVRIFATSSEEGVGGPVDWLEENELLASKFKHDDNG
uniref:Uncharacterized protein n=1 Tax=Pseudictyota dubia TaxID=2749911 RepID=A0A7R9VKZ6_9STRA|mmetsp:Transcript_17674/g.32822  ORF Transcript_17674/g.32822 Transcript_17674/m.32822 type:complete len:113 (+) Transcript_17674:174-512(+)